MRQSFSSHILAEVQQLCNRVAIIKDGGIVRVEEIAALREDNYKKITIRGKDIVEEDYLMDGCTEIKRNEDELKFYYKGDINKMTRAISFREVKDVLIEEPTLEEIFMHYYK